MQRADGVCFNPVWSGLLNSDRAECPAPPLTKVRVIMTFS